jgi:hypothetical protein
MATNAEEEPRASRGLLSVFVAFSRIVGMTWVVVWQAGEANPFVPKSRRVNVTQNPAFFHTSRESVRAFVDSFRYSGTVAR